MSDQLLTVRQLADESGLSIDKVYSALAPKGDLPCIRTQIGSSAKRRTHGAVRVRRSEWEAWLERHTCAPRASRDVVRVAGRSLQLEGADRYL